MGYWKWLFNGAKFIATICIFKVLFIAIFGCIGFALLMEFLSSYFSPVFTISTFFIGIFFMSTYIMYKLEAFDKK